MESIYQSHQTAPWAGPARQKYHEIVTDASAARGRYEAARERASTTATALRKAQDHLAELQEYVDRSQGRADENTVRQRDQAAAEVAALRATHEQLSARMQAASADAVLPIRLAGDARRAMIALQLIRADEV